MCYSKRVSAITWFISWISSLALFGGTNNQSLHSLALFFFWIGLQQLWDWLLWSWTPPDIRNFIVTKVSMLCNHAQPIILWIVSPWHHPLPSMFVFLYIGAAIPYTIQIWDRIVYTEVTCVSNPSLEWKWNNQPGANRVYSLFMLSFLTQFALGFATPWNYLLCIFSILSYLVAWLDWHKQQVVGRFWCWLGALGPILLWILEHFL